MIPVRNVSGFAVSWSMRLFDQLIHSHAWRADLLEDPSRSAAWRLPSSSARETPVLGGQDHIR
ncbi:hypothetical protein ALI144C_29965 [Actinosynnema sp. ALI-1.44]|nr:hypothetical protein ALI144C_29965 [Actinosynnema sp. ALI-1.44]